MIEHKYLKLDEVIAMLNVSRNWFYKMRKAGKFVKPAIERPMRWRLDQINNFLDGAEWKNSTYKKLEDAMGILEQEKLDILGDEFGVEIDDDAAYLN